MNELLPIIRRKRKPLLPVESVAVVPTARGDARPTETENIEQPTSNSELPEAEDQSRLTSAATNKESNDAKAPVKRNPR